MSRECTPALESSAGRRRCRQRQRPGGSKWPSAPIDVAHRRIGTYGIAQPAPRGPGRPGVGPSALQLRASPSLRTCCPRRRCGMALCPWAGAPCRCQRRHPLPRPPWPPRPSCSSQMPWIAYGDWSGAGRDLRPRAAATMVGHSKLERSAWHKAAAAAAHLAVAAAIGLMALPHPAACHLAARRAARCRRCRPISASCVRMLYMQPSAAQGTPIHCRVSRLLVSLSADVAGRGGRPRGTPNNRTSRGMSDALPSSLLVTQQALRNTGSGGREARGIVAPPAAPPSPSTASKGRGWGSSFGKEHAEQCKAPKTLTHSLDPHRRPSHQPGERESR